MLQHHTPQAAQATAPHPGRSSHAKILGARGSCAHQACCRQHLSTLVVSAHHPNRRHAVQQRGVGSGAVAAAACRRRRQLTGQGGEEGGQLGGSQQGRVSEAGDVQPGEARQHRAQRGRRQLPARQQNGEARQRGRKACAQRLRPVRCQLAQQRPQRRILRPRPPRRWPCPRLRTLCLALGRCLC